MHYRMLVLILLLYGSKTKDGGDGVTDYLESYRQLLVAVSAAQKELRRRNYGVAEQILSEAMQEHVQTAGRQPENKLPEHSLAAYARRHHLCVFGSETE